MRKTSLLVFGLVVLMILTPAAYAQSDSNALLRIVNMAQKQIERQLEHADVSPEIKKLYENGVTEVNALKQAVKNNDATSAKNHFLKAMNLFKKITQLMSDQSRAVANEEISPQRYYESDLKRIKKLVSTLKAIAKDKSINFDEVDKLVREANIQIQNGDHKTLKNTIKHLKTLLDQIQKDLRKHSAKTSSNREIKFFTLIIERLENKQVDADSLNEAKRILSELKELVAQERYDEAKQLKQTLTSLIRELYSSA